MSLYWCVYVVTAIGSCQILILIYIKLTLIISASICASQPSSRVCVCMHLIQSAEVRVFSTHTYMCVWWEVSAASVVFAMVATECSCLVQSDWCVRTDKNMSLANSFLNTFSFFIYLFFFTFVCLTQRIRWILYWYWNSQGVKRPCGLSGYNFITLRWQVHIFLPFP